MSREVVNFFIYRMIRRLEDLAAEAENNAEKQNPAIVSVKNTKEAVFGKRFLGTAGAQEAAAYFHAKITSNKESYASGSTAIYSVNYTIDRDKIHEEDYDYSEGCGDSGV